MAGAGGEGAAACGNQKSNNLTKKSRFCRSLTRPSGTLSLRRGKLALPRPYLFTLIILPPQTGEGRGGGQPGGETGEGWGEGATACGENAASTSKKSKQKEKNQHLLPRFRVNC